MDWVTDHQVLIAACVLVALALIGITVIVVRGLKLVRTARAGMETFEGPVAVINDGLADAERKMEVIAAGQADLNVALDRVSVQTGELRIMLEHVSQAFSILRAPLRYFGR